MSHTRIDRAFLTVGAALVAVGVVLVLLGMPQAGPAGLAQSYFFGFVCVATLTFGFFGLSLLHHAAKGHWGYPVLRLLEAGGGWRALLLVLVLWVPVATVFRQALYPWSNPDVVKLDPIIQHKAAYLNDARWAVFSVLALGAFMFWAYRNAMWQRNEDESGEKKWRDLRTNWSAPGLVLFVIFVNFLYTDWVMSQDPHWYSTIYGVWFLVGGVLGALGLTSLVIGTQAKKAPYAEVVRPWLTKDLGNLMLAFTMLWAYFSFSQYLIIWSGHLPEYTPYWIRRSNGGWHLLGNSLLVAQFFVPFLLLLIPKVKRVPGLLAAVGGWVLLMRFFDLQYTVAPTFRPQMVFQFLDAGFLLALVGAWCAVFGFTLSTSPLLVWRPEQRGVSLEVATDHA